MKRRIFHVSHLANDQWVVKEQGAVKPSGKFATKGEAIADARRIGMTLEEGGGLAQMIIHREDGSFEEERTFGADPRASVG